MYRGVCSYVCPRDKTKTTETKIAKLGSGMTIPEPSLAILVSVVLVLSRGQTDRITEADQRNTHATIPTIKTNNVVNVVIKVTCPLRGIKG